MGTTPRILILDDDPFLLEAARSMLAFAGCDARGETDAGRFRVEAREGGYDLLMIDLLPGDGGGIDLCQAVRNDGWAGPILVFASKPLYELERRAIDRFRAATLMKPFGPRELTRRVWECLSP
jgi:two-component system, OmpR family, phosphate regulon response regulator OmpR